MDKLDLLKENRELKERNSMLITSIDMLNKEYTDLIKAHKARLDVIYRLTKDL